MIFGALGSQKFPMDRLLIRLDQLIEQKNINEEVFVQTGHCQYKPIHFESIPFLDRDKFEHYVEKCDLLITHAGAGAMMAGLKRNKKVIAIPRLKKYGEHVDNHQQELARVLSEKGYLIMLEDMSMLQNSITKARNSRFEVYESSTNRIIDIINDYLSIT